MWGSRWEFRPLLNWKWWVFGFIYEPNWLFTIAIGPVALQFSKSEYHI
jgi:hypothetical protein